MSIGAAWGEIWKPVWGSVWSAESAPAGTPFALPGHTATAWLTRRSTKPILFDEKDPDEDLYIAFDWRLFTASITSPEVIATRYSGEADASPSSIISGSPSVIGAKAYQRIVAGVDACTYHLECRATSAEGNRYVLSALLPVRSA